MNANMEFLVWKRKDKQASFALYGVSRFFKIELSILLV
jgi:hypothetical protein